MLSIAQKAAILRKTGVAIPAAPSDAAGGLPIETVSATFTPSSDATSAPMQIKATREWIAAVDALFVNYVAARAAKSLREAEEARQLGMLRRMSARPFRTVQAAQRA
jgi:hypothetical protein